VQKHKPLKRLGFYRVKDFTKLKAETSIQQSQSNKTFAFEIISLVEERKKAA